MAKGRNRKTASRPPRRDVNVVELQSPIKTLAPDKDSLSRTWALADFPVLPGVVVRTHVRFHLNSDENFALGVPRAGGGQRRVFDTKYTSAWIPIQDFVPIAVTWYFDTGADGENTAHATWWYELRGYRAE